jgi:hypothetical protein
VLDPKVEQALEVHLGGNGSRRFREKAKLELEERAPFPQFFVFCFVLFFSILGFALRAYTLSHSTSLFL